MYISKYLDCEYHWVAFSIPSSNRFPQTKLRTKPASAFEFALAPGRSGYWLRTPVTNSLVVKCLLQFAGFKDVQVPTNN